MSVVVEVSARQFMVPRECSCCGAIAQRQVAATYTRITGVRVIREQTRSLMFPYCEGCVQHIAHWDSASSTAKVVLGIAVVVGVVLAFGGAGAPAFAAAVAIGALLASVAFVRIRRQARAAQGANCACPSASVIHLGWSGSVSGFAFASERYGVAFAMANHEKLINVSIALQRLLEIRATELRLQVAGAPRRSPPPIPAASRSQQHAVEGRPNRQSAPADAVLDWISRIESYKGAEARRNALIRALEEVTDPAGQRQLRVAASRIDTEAVLDKVESLATDAAKRRHLEKAIAALRSDDIPDALQAEQLRELEARLRPLR